MAEASSEAQLAGRPVPQVGAFVLHKLASDLPLSADGEQVTITCVEAWSKWAHAFGLQHL
jgi:hypothetical protein